jgi:hypothetical protein
VNGNDVVRAGTDEPSDLFERSSLVVGVPQSVGTRERFDSAQAGAGGGFTEDANGSGLSAVADLGTAARADR